MNQCKLCNWDVIFTSGKRPDCLKTSLRNQMFPLSKDVSHCSMVHCCTSGNAGGEEFVVLTSYPGCESAVGCEIAFNGASKCCPIDSGYSNSIPHTFFAVSQLHNEASHM